MSRITTEDVAMLEEAVEIVTTLMAEAMGGPWRYEQGYGGATGVVGTTRGDEGYDEDPGYMLDLGDAQLIVVMHAILAEQLRILLAALTEARKGVGAHPDEPGSMEASLRIAKIIITTKETQ